MIDDNIDLLQVKIEKAKEKLSKEARSAIDSVNWRKVILEMREKKGYNIDQLGELEIETELLLCGLTTTEQYTKELENRMKIPKTQVEMLVNELNELIFRKIKDELIKLTNLNNKKEQVDALINTETTIKSADTEDTPDPQIKPAPTKTEIKPEDKYNIDSILSKKLTGAFKIGGSTTEYSLNNISKQNELSGTNNTKENNTKSVDPYRMPIE